MMKKLLSGLMMVVCTVLILVACGNNADGDVDTITVGYMPNYASINLVAGGVTGGYFEEEGIEIEFVEFADGPTIIAALESGSIDVGNIGPGAHVLPAQGRAEIIAMSQLGNADAVIGLRSHGVASLEDLRGKTIATATGTSSEAILNLTLEAAGLTRDDVTVVDMDASAITTAMLSGGVDAAATWSPNTHTIIEELGDDAVVLTRNEDFESEFPSISSWVVNPGFADDNAELMERFLSALFRGMDYRVANGEDVARWVANQIGVDEDSVLQQLEDANWPTSAQILAKIEDGTLLALYEQQIENFIEQERLTADEVVPVAEHVRTDLMLEALND